MKKTLVICLFLFFVVALVVAFSVHAVYGVGIWLFEGMVTWAIMRRCLRHRTAIRGYGWTLADTALLTIFALVGPLSLVTILLDVIADASPH